MVGSISVPNTPRLIALGKAKGREEMGGEERQERRKEGREGEESR